MQRKLRMGMIGGEVIGSEVMSSDAFRYNLRMHDCMNEGMHELL